MVASLTDPGLRCTNQRSCRWRGRVHWARDMRTVLILDDDLGFVFWLGEALTVAQFQPIPAQSVATAERLLRTLKIKVGLLIVNPAVPGAAEFARALRHRHEKLRVVAALGHPDDLEIVVRDADTARTKPHILDELARSEWQELVRGILSGVSKGPARKAAARESGL